MTGWQVLSLVTAAISISGFALQLGFGLKWDDVHKALKEDRRLRQAFWELLVSVVIFIFLGGFPFFSEDTRVVVENPFGSISNFIGCLVLYGLGVAVVVESLIKTSHVIRDKRQAAGGA
ncbi:MAG: hypothetical protein JO122_16750 [Acetobacteraceae bacterium]|nr:hypothetical protein [Acetobacteraceae bacterium]